MTATLLIRKDIKEHFSKALNQIADGSHHAGLILDKGYAEDNPSESTAKTAFIQNICKTQAGSFYKNALNRWLKLTQGGNNEGNKGNKGNKRFLQSTFTLENRLLIGLNGAGALETGCSISHTHGMPYIPGSSIKGAVRNWIQQNENLKEHKAQWIELFGSAPDEEDDDSFSGLVTFHDAWWVPGTAPTKGGTNSNSPFVQEIVTTHHLEYYGQEGKVEASDMDSPVPNPDIS